jgi:hypothetical protein
MGGAARMSELDQFAEGDHCPGLGDERVESNR